MAMYNKTDGSKYSLETILEVLDARFKKEAFPHLGDALGSDWGDNRAARTFDMATPEGYKAAAYALAEMIYA